ncbi:MAG: helix-turn-helix transcriptional regulator [Hyphomicrobiales bacterium]|uniref:helix-turn-helix transcriptional regulator n=1 Tax=Shimia thalassica TaxID=1715693 RepID=UPI003297B981
MKSDSNRLAKNIFDNVALAIKARGTTEICLAIREMLASAFEFDNYLVIAYRGEENPVILHRSGASKRVHAELDSHYVPSLYVLDPFYAAHINRIESGVYLLRDLAPDKFNTTSYYREYYKKTTLLDELSFFGYSLDGWTYNVCVGRDETSGRPFTKPSVTKAMELAPVVVSILESRWEKMPFERAASNKDIPNLVASLIKELADKHDIRITNRQAQVALLLLRGHSSRSIGMQMDISWQTVRVFRKQLYSRCGISSQAELFSLLVPMVEIGQGSAQ